MHDPQPSSQALAAEFAEMLERDAREYLAPAWEWAELEPHYPANAVEVSALLKTAGIYADARTVAEYGPDFTAIRIVNLASTLKAQQ